MSEEQVVAQKLRRTATEIEQIVSEFQSSGMSRSQFCRVRGLTFGVLNRYLERIRAAGSGSENGDGLVAVNGAARSQARSAPAAAASPQSCGTGAGSL